MKYSIIIPVYNAQKTLEQCVSSVTSQTFDDCESVLFSCEIMCLNQVTILEE